MPTFARFPLRGVAAPIALIAILTTPAGAQRSNMIPDGTPARSAPESPSVPSAARPPAQPAAVIDPGFTLTLTGAAAKFGSAVAVAGDVNGDGYSDLIVGAPSYSNGQSGEGEVLLFLGGPTGYSTAPTWTFESNVAGANLGWSVAPAGDVNGDGYADVIVGAPNLGSNGLTNNGRAYLLLGGPSGLASSPAWTFDGTQAGQLLGWSVCTAGDVNADGYDDVIVGSPGYQDITGPELEARHASPAGLQQTDVVFNNGRVYAFYGGSSGLPASPSWVKSGFQYAGAFGYSVSTAHDVNGDGYDDIVASAPYGQNLYTHVNGAGEFDVFLGGASGVSTTASTVSYGSGMNELRGFSVAGIGDMDGDGYADVAVGAPGYTNAVANQGAVIVFRGSSLGLFVDWDFLDQGPVYNVSLPGGQFGYSVAPAGDVNGDGFADFVVGAPFYTPAIPGAINIGYVAVYQGTSQHTLVNNTNYARLAFSISDGRGSELGYSVCSAGDEDGDGFGDVVAGAPTAALNDGRVSLFRGTADAPQTVPSAAVPIPPSQYSTPPLLYVAGDVDGDGFDDLVIADTTKLEFFRGSPGALSPSPVWSIAASSLAPGCALDRASPLGDVNGDGYDDIQVLVQLSSSAPHSFVLAGGPSGPTLPPLWDAPGEIAEVGDVNGDGYADCVRMSDTTIDTLEVHAGGPSGPDPTPISTLVLPGGNWNRVPLITTGDFNGDGFDDLIVDYLKYSGSYANQGKAMVFLGSPTGVSSTPAMTFVGSKANVELFASFAGDLNGDGYTDIAIKDTSTIIVYGNSALPQLSFVPSNGWVEADVFGDFNGDGYDDVGFESTGGSIEIHLGSATGLSTSPWVTLPVLSRPWENSTIFNGIGIGRCDLNGDGTSDVAAMVLAFSSPSVYDTAWVTGYYGNSGVADAPGLDRAARQRRSSDTAPIGLLGLSDQSTQFRLAANGRSAAGRTRVRMESDVKNWGASYETNLGNLVHDSWSATGAPGTDGSLVALDAARSLPQTGPTNKWRMRIAAHSPYFPWTPWLSPTGNGRAEYDLRNASSVAAVGVQSSPAPPERIALAAPLPNPSRGETRLVFTLPRRTTVDLAIYDLAGRRIATLAHGEKEAGTHVAVWNARGAGAGLYFAQLLADGRKMTERIALVK